jgi:hypothetical protein
MKNTPEIKNLQATGRIRMGGERHFMSNQHQLRSKRLRAGHLFYLGPWVYILPVRPTFHRIDTANQHAKIVIEKEGLRVVLRPIEHVDNSVSLVPEATRKDEQQKCECSKEGGVMMIKQRLRQ